MREQPLFWAALCLALGIWLGPHAFAWRLAVCLLAAASGLGLALWYWLRRSLLLPCAILSLCCLGMLLVPAPISAAAAARITAIRGWCDGETLHRGTAVYFGCRLSAWRAGNGPWRKPPRTYRLWLTRLPARIDYGLRFEAAGGLTPAARPAGVDGFFRVKRIEAAGGRAGNPMARAAAAVRAAMDKTFQRYLGSVEHALMAGLVFGDLPQLSPKILAWFRDSGTVHLLSAGGLHVGFIVALSLGLAGLLGWRDLRAWALALPAVLGYAAICGNKPPILRAAVMAMAVGVGVLWRRRLKAANLFGLAALAVLAVQPSALWTLSFQLTFTACAGLLFLYPSWVSWCPARLAMPGRPLLVSLAATLAVLPIQAAVFGRMSLIGPLANLALVPLAGIIVPLGLVSGLIGAVLPWLAAPMVAGLGLLLDLMLALARLAASLPVAACNLPAWPPWLTACYYLGLGLLGFGARRNTLNKKPRLAPVTLALTAAVLLAMFLWWHVLAVPRDLSVTFLDVGQGDCTIIRAPGGQTAMVDGGGEEMGPRILAYLRRQGINRLDLLIITHPHSDHIGGLEEVAGEIPIGRVLDPGWANASASYRRLLLELKAQQVPWQRARRGLAFKLGMKVTGSVLYPFADAPPPEDCNDGSLVIRLRFGGETLLLPGDLSAEGEAALLQAGDDLSATLLKVAHHGSESGTSPLWLAAVRPRAAVIPVGRNNSFHHPHPSTLARLWAAGVKVCRLDKSGTVRWRTDGRQYRLEAVR